MKYALPVAYHKDHKTLACSKDYFFPIHVGHINSKIKLDIQPDDEGDNISNLNDKICEITAMYWGWKHLDADYYGMFHYRRYFRVEESIQEKVKQFLRKVLDRELKYKYEVHSIDAFTKEVKKFSKKLPIYLNKADIVVPFPKSLKNGITIETHYLDFGLPEDWCLLKEVIEKNNLRIKHFLNK